LPVVSAENSKQIDLRFASFLKIHPDHAAASYYLARDLLNPKDGAPSDDDVQSGEKLLRIAVQKDPKLAGAHFELGRLCEKKEQSAEAAREYQAAIAIEPDHEQYHYRLSIVYRQLGQLEKAKEEFQTFERLRAMKDEKYGPKNLDSSQKCRQ
jgi:tetratricopeptide (TPR) repeat protein